MINYKCTWTCKCISRKLRQKWHEWRISLFSQGGFIYFIYTSQKMKHYTPSTSFKNLFVRCLNFFLYCFNLYVDGSKVAAVLTILQKSEMVYLQGQIARLETGCQEKTTKMNNTFLKFAKLFYCNLQNIEFLEHFSLWS